MNTITLPYHHKRLPVETEEIIKLEGSGNYTLFHLLDGRQILTSKSLIFYEELLSFPFVRVHKSCLVNIHYVTQRKTSTLLSLSDGSEVHVARRRKAIIKQYMGSKRKSRTQRKTSKKTITSHILCTYDVGIKTRIEKKTLSVIKKRI